MDPLITDVFDGARAVFNDYEIQGGETFTNDIMQKPFEIAYRELWDGMMLHGVKFVEQQVYYSLPAYTSMLVPSQIGLSNFGEPVRLRERAVTADKTITSVTVVASGLQVTATSHGCTQNQEVTVWGVQGQLGANGRFFVDLVDANNVILRGAQNVAAYTSGGTLTYGGDQFIEMHRVVDNLPQGTPNNTLDYWLWRGDRFLFWGATTERELEITYTASGAAPTTGRVGIDDSLNFLIFATAYHTLFGRELYDSMIGPIRDNKDRALHAFIQTIVRNSPGRRAKSYRDRFRRSAF